MTRSRANFNKGVSWSQSLFFVQSLEIWECAHEFVFRVCVLASCPLLVSSGRVGEHVSGLSHI